LKEVRETAHEFISIIEEEIVKERDKEKEKKQEHEKADPYGETLVIQEKMHESDIKDHETDILMIEYGYLSIRKKDMFL
jgi:hypothetical protein